jgi:biopolymer transport protein ExbB
MEFLARMSGLLVAQAGGEGAAAPAAASSAAEIQSVLDFVMKGGVMMIPIGVCSLIALTVFAERLITLRRGRVIPRSFLPGLHAVMKKHPGQREHALAYCRQNGSPVARVFGGCAGTFARCPSSRPSRRSWACSAPSSA